MTLRKWNRSFYDAEVYGCDQFAHSTKKKTFPATNPTSVIGYPGNCKCKQNDDVMDVKTLSTSRSSIWIIQHLMSYASWWMWSCYEQSSTCQHARRKKFQPKNKNKNIIMLPLSVRSALAFFVHLQSSCSLPACWMEKANIQSQQDWTRSYM